MIVAEVNILKVLLGAPLEISIASEPQAGVQTWSCNLLACEAVDALNPGFLASEMGAVTTGT